jgi:hypothetical protein
MKGSKLIDLLKVFSPEEMEEFGDFVSSPYFNKREELIPFYLYLRSLAPEWKEEALEKKSVFRNVFPYEQYDEKQFAYLMNYLLKLGERYLARKTYEKRLDAEELDILESFVEKGLNKHYQFLINKIIRKYDDSSDKGTDFFYNRFRLAHIRLEYFNSLKKRALDPSFLDFSEFLDDFFMYEKLRHASSMATLKDTVSAELSFNYVDEINQHLRESEDIDPLIHIYQKLYLSYQDDDPEHFEAFLKLLSNNVDRTSIAARRELYVFAINYCGRKIMAGQTAYYEKVLDLYMEGVDNRALFEGKYLSPTTYTNIVKLALGLRKIEILEDFIETHSGSLPPDKRADAEYLNRAEVLYYKKDYGGVIENLREMVHSDFHYTLSSRVLYLKTYYAQDDIEPLLSQVTAFNQYLRRNKKMSASVKKPFSNFCKCLGMILRVTPKKYDTIKAKIEEMNPVAEKNWLLRTLEQELA